MDKKSETRAAGAAQFFDRLFDRQERLEEPGTEPAEVERPTTIVMYGVRPPVQEDKAGELREKPLTAAPVPDSDAAAPVLDEVRPENGK